jgi:ER-bound oxygenase mpaB/B'/Rubber oxygenase, catalytic domain
VAACCGARRRTPRRTAAGSVPRPGVLLVGCLPVGIGGEIIIWTARSSALRKCGTSRTVCGVSFVGDCSGSTPYVHPVQPAAVLGRRSRRLRGRAAHKCELIGVHRVAAPASMAELDAYYEEIRPRLYACDEAKEALRLTFHPPVPEGNRVLKLGLPPVSALAFATLPRWARRMYGRPNGPLSDMAATAGIRAARLVFSQQRLFLGAMRAIHRAGVLHVLRHPSSMS